MDSFAERLLNDFIFASVLPSHRNSPASFYDNAINCSQSQSSGFMRRTGHTNQTRAIAFTASLNALLNEEREIMKAKIVDDLLETIEQEMPHEGHRDDPEFLALRDRIQGQVVELRFIAGDAFEVQDNRFWLPNSCWEGLEQ